jgi:hypothetical protein
LDAGFGIETGVAFWLERRPIRDEGNTYVPANIPAIGDLLSMFRFD